MVDEFADGDRGGTASVETQEEEVEILNDRYAPESRHAVIQEIAARYAANYEVTSGDQTNLARLDDTRKRRQV